MSDQTEEQTEAVYSESTQTQDLKRRHDQENENLDLIVSTWEPLEEAKANGTDRAARDFTVEGNKTDAYLNGPPENIGYGIPQNQALRAEEGPEAVIEEQVYGSAADNSPHDADSADDEEESAPADPAPAPAKKAAASPKPDDK